MKIEDLNKRKEVLENNLKQVNEVITQNTQQAFSIQVAIINVKEIIAEEEKKEKEEKEKGKKENTKKKKE